MVKAVIRIGMLWLTALFGVGCSTYDFSGMLAAGSSVQERFDNSVSLPDCDSHPAVVRSAAANYGFWVASDFHVQGQSDWDRLGGFLKQACTAPCEVGLLLGDYLYEAGSSLERFRDSLQVYPEICCLTAIGNHEVYKDGYQRAYRPVFGATCYAVRVEMDGFSDLFVVLDSANGTLGNRQYDWLESLLEREREGVRHCFIGTHANFFSPAGYVDVISTYPVDEWMRLLDLFERHRVTAVFSGHSHMRDETTLGGVRYVTVGSWCDDKREWAWVECRTDSSLQIDFRSVD